MFFPPSFARPAALSGASQANQEFGEFVVDGIGLEATDYSGGPIPLKELSKYLAVVFTERDEEAMRTGSLWAENQRRQNRIQHQPV